jgi:hypothetical protein
MLPDCFRTSASPADTRLASDPILLTVPYRTVCADSRAVRANGWRHDVASGLYAVLPAILTLRSVPEMAGQGYGAECGEAEEDKSEKAVDKAKEDRTDPVGDEANGDD